VLKPLRLEDAVQVQPLFGQWDVVQYLASAVPWPFPADGAETFYREVALPAVARGDAWDWTLRLKSDPERIIGAIGLYRKEPHRGFWIAPGYRRQGLMTEASDAVTDFWFNTLLFPVMRVPKATVNAGSRRISEKSGMRVVEVRDGDYVCGSLPTEVWEITASEWRARERK
jgi:ribosomal-protein-alanine N-acetyltransferase